MFNIKGNFRILKRSRGQWLARQYTCDLAYTSWWQKCSIHDAVSFKEREITCQMIWFSALLYLTEHWTIIQPAGYYQRGKPFKMVKNFDEHAMKALMKYVLIWSLFQ